MKAGFTFSTIGHAVILGWGLISLSSAPEPLAIADVEALPVDIVPIEELVKAVEGAQDADLTETPAPVPTTRPETQPDAVNVGDTDQDKKAEPEAEALTPVEKAAVEPAPPPPTARPERKPEPVKTAEPEPKIEAPKPVEAPEPEPEKVVEEAEQFAALPQSAPAPTRRPSPEKPAPKKAEAKSETKPSTKQSKKSDSKKKSTTDEIADLLNKQKQSKGGAKRSTKTASLGTREGRAEKLSTNETAALRGRLGECWTIPTFVDQENLKVTLFMRLTQDGVMSEIVDVDVVGVSNSRHVSAIRSSLSRSLHKSRCRFDDVLPAGKYETWKEVRVNYDPNAY